MTSQPVDFNQYADMLTMQAKMCFPFEYGFYTRIMGEDIKKIAEVGCGNGYYLSLLKEHFPKPSFTGFDHSSEFIEIARKFGDSNINFQKASVEGLNSTYDLVILRLILHQLEDRIGFIKKLAKTTKPDVKVVIIEPDDSMFRLYPELLEFSEHLKRHRKVLSPNTATRNLKFCIKQELADANFELVNEISYYVPSMIQGYKEMYYKYILSTSNIIGCTQNVREDINKWYAQSNSFAQIGLFMYTFKKINSEKIEC